MLVDAAAGRRRRGVDRAAPAWPETSQWPICRATIAGGSCAALLETPLDVRDSRGYNFAEVTAGGIPLEEIDPARMESRVCPRLFLVGEILDVDGRLGGFNFQWAWSSAWVAAQAIARALVSSALRGDAEVRRAPDDAAVAARGAPAASRAGRRAFAATAFETSRCVCTVTMA